MVVSRPWGVYPQSHLFPLFLHPCNCCYCSVCHPSITVALPPALGGLPTVPLAAATCPAAGCFCCVAVCSFLYTAHCRAFHCRVGHGGTLAFHSHAPNFILLLGRVYHVLGPLLGIVPMMVQYTLAHHQDRSPQWEDRSPLQADRSHYYEIGPT